MNAALGKFIADQRERDRKWHEKIAQQEEEMSELAKVKEPEIMPNVVRARARLYRKWLRGYLGNDGKPTHYYNYRLPDTFYRAIRDFALSPLFGSMAIHIIVPKGIAVAGHTGHCNVYYLDGFKVDGWGPWVPIYLNTII